MYHIAKNDKKIAIVCENPQEAYEIIENLSQNGEHYFRDKNGELLHVKSVKSFLFTVQFEGVSEPLKMDKAMK